jgi:hypothetical protein
MHFTQYITPPRIDGENGWTIAAMAVPDTGGGDMKPPFFALVLLLGAAAALGWNAGSYWGMVIGARAAAAREGMGTSGVASPKRLCRVWRSGMEHPRWNFMQCAWCHISPRKELERRARGALLLCLIKLTPAARPPHPFQLAASSPADIAPPRESI